MYSVPTWENHWQNRAHVQPGFTGDEVKTEKSQASRRL